MIRWPDLHDAMREGLQGAIALLGHRGYAETHRKILGLEEEALVPDGDGHWIPGTVPVEYFGPKLSLDDLLALPGMHTALRTLVSLGLVREPRFTDTEGRPVTDPGERNRARAVYTNGGVGEFLRRCLGGVDALAFDADVSESCYADFEEYHASEHAQYSATAPLVGFEADVCPIQLDDATRIIRLDPPELTRLGQSTGRFVGIGPSYPSDLRAPTVLGKGYAIRTHFTVPKGDAVPASGPERRSRAALTALRLLKGGDIRCVAQLLEPVGFTPFRLQTLTHVEPETDRPLRDPLCLSAPDAPKLVQLWSDLRAVGGVQDHSQLAIPVRRYNDVYARRTLEDKVIDLCILLESVLLHGKRDELSFRFALCGAHLLKDCREPHDTYDLLQALYRQRGAVVHGSGQVPKQVAVGKGDRKRSVPSADFVDEVHELAREALRRAVKRVAEGEGLGDITNSLELGAIGSS